MDAREKNKLYKRAIQARKATTRPAKRSRHYEEEEGPAPRRMRETLDDWVLKMLRQEEPSSVAGDIDRVKGEVVWIGLKRCRVRVPGAVLDCELALEIARRQQTLIAVGDEVFVHRESGLDIVREVLPRRSRLARPDPGNPNAERLIVANVDVVVVIVSVKAPPLHPRLIDRYLVAVQRGNAQAAICVNKVDLLSPQERSFELAKLRPYERLGIEVAPCSTLNHEGMARVRQIIDGKTCAFVGHSGVGKSSILNALHPELGIDTGAVSEVYGRGRHTTTASSLYHLGGQTRLIDTPGIRSFGIGDMGPAELCWYFPEFAPFASGCKFRDCSHSHEPGCAVKAAAEADRIPRERYETYLRLLQ